MADESFTLKIEVDGSQAATAAKKIKAELESALTGAFKINVGAGMGADLQKATKSMGALTTEALRLTQVIGDMESVLSSPKLKQAAVKQTSGILSIFKDLYNKLVGNSIIPDMVNDINAWLARIDPEMFGAEALVTTAETTADAVIAEFKAIADVVTLKDTEERIYDLQAAIQGLGSEMMELTTAGASSDPRRLSQFEDAASAVRRLRGGSAEDEAKLAAGMLPRGFGLGAETRYDKPSGARIEGMEETTDEWYQAIKTGAEAKERFTNEQSERIQAVMGELADKETQMATLVESLYAKQARFAEEGFTTEEEYNEMTALEGVLGDIAMQFENIDAAQQGVAAGLETLGGFGEVEVVQEEKKTAQAERAFARSPAGVAGIEAERRLTIEAKAGATERIEIIKAEGRVTVEEEKRKTGVVIAEARARQKVTEAEARGKLAQTQEAAKQTTAQTRGKATLKTTAGKADIAGLERQKKLLLEAQKLAGELGQSWAEVEVNMAASGDTLATVVGEFKALKTEQTAARREQAQMVKLTATLRQQAIALGVPWEEVEEATRRSGLSLKDMQGVMQLVRREQGKAAAASDKWSAVFTDMEQKAQGLGKSISDARNEWQGITQLAGDLQSAGTTLQQTGAAMTGSITLASKKYLDFSKQAGVASRAMSLNNELAGEFNSLIVDMAGDLALVNAEELAGGVTIWGKAIGQTASSEAELRSIIEQTIPAQKLAALSQENLNMLLEGGAASMRQFGMQTSDMERIFATVARGADVTTAEISGIFEALKMVSTAAQLDVPYEDMVAMTAMLAEMGIQGTMAGSGIQRALDDIIAPSSKAAEEIENLFNESQPFFEGGEFVGFPAMIDKLAGALENMSTEQKAATMSTLFDANAVRVLTPLIEGQIAARDKGVNSLRAFSKNMQGTRDAEVEAWAAMKLEQEGVVVDMTGAVDALNQKWDSYEQSDNRRVDLATARWDKLWLTIGGQGVQRALPVLDKAATILTDVTRIMDAHPEIVSIVGGAGAAALAGGTLLNLVGSVARSAVAIKSVVGGFQAWATGQKTATAQFQTTVVTSAQQFQAIVTQAAGQAAGIEIEGAKAETAIETQGATGGKMGALVGAAGLIAAGVMASGIAVKLINQLLEQTGAAQGIREAQTRIKATGRYYQGVPGMADRPEDAARVQGAATGRMSGLADYYAAQEAATETGAAFGDLTGNLENTKAAISELNGLTPEQTKAAELYIDLLKEQKDALADFNAALADAARDLNTDLAKMATDYAKEQTSVIADHYEEQTKADSDFYQQQTDAAAEHQKSMARMEEDHYMRMWDLSLNRDAAGMRREQRDYGVQRKRAEEDFSGNQSQAVANYEQTKAENQRQHIDRLAQMAVEYADERQARLADYEIEVAELQAEHNADMARLEQAYFDKINAEAQYFTRSQEQQNAYMAAMYASAEVWLQAKKGLWDNYVASLPVPTAYTGGGELGNQAQLPEYAAGGYTGGGGAARLHAGEFVMSPQTTSQVETAAGGRLSQGSLVQLIQGGVNLPMSFGGGMGASKIAGLVARQVEAQLEQVFTEAGRQW